MVDLLAAKPEVVCGRERLERAGRIPTAGIFDVGPIEGSMAEVPLAVLGGQARSIGRRLGLAAALEQAHHFAPVCEASVDRGA
jgi:hypothetical protein